jgi:aspartate kinase
VEGKPVNTLYEILNQVKVKPNLTQNTAISLFVCMDDIAGKIEQIALQAEEIFDVQLEKDLTLLTIRHYTNEFIQKLSENKIIVLEQKTLNTIQLLMREVN